MIEFLRIFFIFFVILGHTFKYPEVKQTAYEIFHAKDMHTGFGVEFFFIIGGFFLYRRMMKSNSAFDLIKKIYFRLFPALLLIFLCGVFFFNISIYRFPSVAALTTGLTIPGEVTGWGDWYVGTYFWCCCLFIGLFSLSPKTGFLWTGVLIYFSVCLRFNAPYDGWMKTYYTIIGNQVVRGIYSIGLGIAAGFLAEKLCFQKTRLLSFLFTIFEALCLVCVFNFLGRSNHCRFNFLEMEIAFALLLVSISHSLGYISSFLNKMDKICLISRYVYPVFLGHIVPLRILNDNNSFGLDGITSALVIYAGAIVIGIFEYHLIEKRLLPFLKNKFATVR